MAVGMREQVDVAIRARKNARGSGSLGPAILCAHCNVHDFAGWIRYARRSTAPAKTAKSVGGVVTLTHFQTGQTDSLQVQQDVLQETTLVTGASVLPLKANTKNWKAGAGLPRPQRQRLRQQRPQRQHQWLLLSGSHSEDWQGPCSSASYSSTSRPFGNA